MSTKLGLAAGTELIWTVSPYITDSDPVESVRVRFYSKLDYMDFTGPFL